MDEGALPSLLKLGILIVLHGIVELAYSAFLNSRRNNLKEKAESGDKDARRTLYLVDHLPSLYLTCQVLLTVLRFSIATIALIEIALPMIAVATAVSTLSGMTDLLTIPGVGYAAVLIPVGAVTLIIGDLVPSAFGRTYADQLLPIITPPIRLLNLLLKPVVWVLTGIERVIYVITGDDGLETAVTGEEIMTMVNVGERGGTIETEEKDMIYSVLQFNQTIAREIMIPRQDITAVEISAPIHSALEAIVESGHSRIPVYENDIDHVRGMLYAKDLLNIMHKGEVDHHNLRGLMRTAYFVPDTKPADTLFKELQVGKIHIAVLVDEYGSTAGLVTIEDLIEEIVGDIKDEYDLNEEVEVTPLTENTYLIDGAMNLDDVNDLLNVSLPTDENDTIGGYMTNKIGGAPITGQIVEAENVTMRVDHVENRRILKVHVTRHQPVTAASTQEAAVAAANAAAEARAVETEGDDPASQTRGGGTLDSSRAISFNWLW